MGVDVVAYARSARKWCDLNRLINLNVWVMDDDLYRDFHPQYPVTHRNGVRSDVALQLLDQGIEAHIADCDKSSSEAVEYTKRDLYWCLKLKRFALQHPGDFIFILDDHSNDDYAGRQSCMKGRGDDLEERVAYYKSCGIPEDEIFAYDEWKSTEEDEAWIEAQTNRLLGLGVEKC